MPRRKCVECRAGGPLYRDPCDPPVELGECLCSDCVDGNLQQEIERLEDETRDLERQLESVRKKKNKR